MRNQLRRTSLLLALLVATLLLGSDVFSAEPAGAVSLNSRPMTVGSKPLRPTTGVRQRPAKKKATPKARRVARAPRPKTARSGVRQIVIPGNDVWAKLRACESGGRYNINTGNGFYGAYQFHPRTWRGLGFPGLPHQAPPEMQDAAARKLQARSGWGQWPACSRRLGLR